MYGEFQIPQNLSPEVGFQNSPPDGAIEILIKIKEIDILGILKGYLRPFRWLYSRILVKETF